MLWGVIGSEELLYRTEGQPDKYGWTDRRNSWADGCACLVDLFIVCCCWLHPAIHFRKLSAQILTWNNEQIHREPCDIAIELPSRMILQRIYIFYDNNEIFHQNGQIEQGIWDVLYSTKTLDHRTILIFKYQAINSMTKLKGRVYVFDGFFLEHLFSSFKFGSILHTHIKMTEYVSNQSLVVLTVPLLQILIIGPFKTFVFSWQRYIKELFLYHFTISLPWRDICIPKIIFTCPSTFCTYKFMFS